MLRNPVRDAETKMAGLASFLAIVAVVILAFTGTPAASAHTTQGNATPSNDGPHPWPVHPSEQNACSTPIRSVSSLPGNFDFNHACKHHDGCYIGFPENGVATYWVSRRQCDDWFYEDMLASCKEYQWDLFDLCRNWAQMYYGAVRSEGGQWYEGPVND